MSFVPWGSIVSLAGQAASGVMSAVNNRKMEREREAENARSEAHYEALANENPLARADNQMYLHQYDRSANQSVEQARNSGKVLGATPEYSLGVQKNIADGRASLMGNMSANSSAKTDFNREKAEGVRQKNAKEQRAFRESRNTTYANLASNAANAFGEIVSAYSSPKENNRIKKSVSSVNRLTVGAPPSDLQTEVDKAWNTLKTSLPEPKPAPKLLTEEMVNEELEKEN